MGVCGHPGRVDRLTTRTASHHARERELLSATLNLTAYRVSLPSCAASHPAAYGGSTRESAAESRP
jgi:hypothetical protein